MAVLSGNIRYGEDWLKELQSGNVNELILKKLPLERQIQNAQNTISAQKNDLVKWQTIQAALQANDYNYLDNYVRETESKSKEYLRGLFCFRTNPVTKQPPSGIYK